MHRLDRPTETQAFTQGKAIFLPSYPPAAPNCTEGKRWQAFSNTQQAAREATISVLEKNQHGICAYCEIELRNTNRQIEHFIPKSYTTVNNDLTFDFSNMLLCCFGGTNPHSRVPGAFSNTPSAQANHSCGEKKGDKHPAGICLNPYDLPLFPIFKLTLNDNGISFTPDETACRSASIDPNLAQSTLDFLNLNCPRLNGRRKAVWEVLEEEVTEAGNLPHNQKTAEFESIAKAHLQDNPAFYTTKLLCLADAMPHLIP